MNRLYTFTLRAARTALLLALALAAPRGSLAADRMDPRDAPAAWSQDALHDLPPGDRTQAMRSAFAEPTPLPETYGLVDRWDTALPTGNMLFHPAGIAVDRYGTVVLVERGNHRLTRASSRGSAPNSLQPNQPPQRVGAFGNEPGQFAAPEDVAVDGEGKRIYVADTGNRRVQVLAPSGQVMAIWPDVGLPRGIALGPGIGPDGALQPDARVYVADAEGRRVRVFDREGIWIEDWTAGGGLVLPLGLSLTPDGDLAVADHGRQRIVWLDADGSEGPEGAEVGALSLDNRLGPGGAPLDVGQNDDGELYVAVARGVLRFRPTTPGGIGPEPQGSGVAAKLAFASELPPLRQRPCARACLPLAPPCDLVESEIQSHEGIQRLDLRPGVGLFITYAPSQRWLDRVVVYPAIKPRGRISGPESNNINQNWSWPKPCRDYPTAEYRHATDPDRIDAGLDDPYYAIALDSAGWLRNWQADGRWYDGLHEMLAMSGIDLAVQRAPEPGVAILLGNQMHRFGPRCMKNQIQTPFPPDTCRLPPIDVLDRAQLIRRERTNECRRSEPIPWRPALPGPCIPDDGFWHTALSYGASTMAVLDTGDQRVVVRGALAELVAGPALEAPTAPFRAYMDLEYDAAGQLWVLARDGALRLFDAAGRDRGEMTLVGPAQGRAEALAAAPDGSFFVLTGDGWLLKYAAETAPPPTATPPRPTTPGPSPRPTRTPSRPTGTPLPTLAARALPRAAWRIEDLAGPGRYRDLDVGSDGRVLVTDGDHDRVLVFAPQPQPPGPSPTPDPESPRCRFASDKVASPSRLQLGETTDLRLTLSGDCGSQHAAMDVIAVVDASCQMSGERLARSREALVALVDAMTQPGDRLGIVSFLEDPGQARLLVPLTADREVLREAGRSFDTDCHIIERCLNLNFQDLGYMRSFLYPYGCLTEGRISDGLRAGREALFGPASRADAGKALILLSPSLPDSQHILASLSLNPATFDPPFTPAEMDLWKRDLPDVILPVTDRERALWEAGQLREAGVRVLTSGVGPDSVGFGHAPDEGLLAAVAWPADGYRPAGAPSDLIDVLAGDGRELSARWLMHSLVITDRIPVNMRLMPGSVQPPAEILPDGGRADAILRWTFRDLPLSGPPALTYRLEPKQAGIWPTNIEAYGDYLDGLGRAGRSDFPVPQVEVIGPTPTDEPTPENPTSVPRSSSTPGPSPGPGTPDASATPPAVTTATTTPPAPSPAPLRPLYLPYLERWRCLPSRQAVDVVLVLDTSTSMLGEKLASARRAAGRFVDLLDLREGRDRAAVIGFDSSVRLAQGLSHDPVALRAALASLSPAPGTRTDLGLILALGELTGSRSRPAVDRVILLLTDGLPQAGTEVQAIAAGQRARDLGITTWVIGLEADPQAALLRQIAGGDAWLRLSPDAAGLDEIYRQIASGIVCR